MALRLKILVPILIVIVTKSIAAASTNSYADPISGTLNPYYLDHARNRSLAPEKRLVLYDTLLTMAKPPYAKARMLYEKGRLYHWMAHYSDAVACFDKAMELVPQDSLSLRLNLLLNLSNTYKQKYNYDKSTDAAFEILGIDKPDSLRYMNVLAYESLQCVFDKLQNSAGVTKYLEEARVEYAQIDSALYPQGWHTARQVLYHMEAIDCIWDDNIEKTYTLLNKALQYASDPETRFICLGNLALFAQDTRQFDIAGQYYKQCLEMENEAEPYFYSIMTLNYINFHVAQGKFQEARELMSANATVLDRLRGGPMEKGIWLNLYEIENGTGHYKEAMEAIQKAYTVYYNQVSEENNKYLADISERLEKRRENVQRQSMTDSLKQRTGIIVLLSGLVIVIAILAFIYRRRERKNNQRSQSLEVMIQNLDREHREEVRETEASLDRSSRELNSLAMQMARLSDSHMTILKELDNKSVNAETRLARVEHYLKQFSREDNLWDMFYSYFEQSNRVFFSRLMAICPELTKAEMRMAAFILMNLTTNEIATMTHRSRRTVSNIKYTLRKKLAINEPTEAFLHRICQATDSDFDRMYADNHDGKSNDQPTVD